MFESAELGHSIDKATFEQEVPGLRDALIDAQYDLTQTKQAAVIILVGGMDGTGKSETAHLLSEWMDPRYLQTLALGEPTAVERQLPAMARFWRALPGKGKISIFFNSWATDPVWQRVAGDLKPGRFQQYLQDTVRFEKMLRDEGVLLVKFWFHLPKKRQKERLESLQKDPRTRWRITDQEWDHYHHYDKFCQIAEQMLRETSTAEAPWMIVEGTDHRFRELTVGRVLLENLRKLAPAPAPALKTPPLLPAMDQRTVLTTLDLMQKIAKDDYESQLEQQQGRFNQLTRKSAFKNHALVVVFEGFDAAGKGGSIRRVSQALDARQYQIIPVSAPTEEELAQPYLWRFWRHLPLRERIVIFDRSWYGRVLVERVEGLCTEADWLRAYSEINDFEQQLVESEIILVKFWLSLSKEEQLKRFQARESDRFKRFKLTEDDWRNRAKWDLYGQAVCDMVDRTSTDLAPWTLIAAEDKYFARIQILNTLCEKIEAALS
ncbi:polyphosphate:AMP phosphotransferase [Candidatus Cyanaurora vandensis]|uniref:polyphosphate:AMP phosphotransferase n=1 Tax=Candidatus Cyanaurora vandensis TaxID=2714958 RepID=UPI00257CE47B|nr:polyphosphate:AMP phosphotransferase [Candidatus Cyanaurora vandensis]